jgi:DNA-directed RNA polymerase alpha subunit
MSKQKKKEVTEEEEVEEEEVEAEEVEEESFYTKIEKLEDSGISASDIAKLKLGGCFTVESIMMRTKKDLAAIKGLSEAKIDKIFDSAAKMVKGGFITGSAMAEKRKGVIKITTGSKAFDKYSKLL